ncbi:chaplin family protein [Actinomadura fulvescens]|uniref:Chaplin domain-containing protein n=1 Tax=Actinomadura fulvescens TaxID=46160 RepID=A0ABP6CBY0_9ACTN
MRTWAKGTARAAMLTASFVALGAGTAIPSGAFADTTSGDSSVLGGNQFNLPISAPINASGNAVGALGTADAASKGGAAVDNGRGGGIDRQTSGKQGVGSGNQVNAPISAPINACGNAIAIFGTADAGCKGGSAVKNSGGPGAGQRTSGERGVGSGNQVNIPVSAPVNACGNAVALFGSSEAGCKGGSKVVNGQGGGSGSGQQTSGASGAVAGNQVHAPISAPINICGNAAAVLGDAVAGCEGGAKVKNGGRTGAGQSTSGQSGVVAGNQVNAPISAPISACGNAVGNAVADCDGGASVRNGGHGSGGQTTSGDHSLGGGNQVNAPVSIPVSACGNAVAVLGEAGAFCEGGSHVRSSSGGDQITSGNKSVGGGNQVNLPISIPVNACGNAVAILGEAAASCDGSVVVTGSKGSGATTSGQQGAGSGNQVNPPASAPVNACGNAVGALGHSEPQCGEGPSSGGYEPYSRTSGANRADSADAARGLPTLPGTTKDNLPSGPTSAMPTLPRLSGKSSVLPSKSTKLPAGRSAATDGPVTLPSLSDLPVNPGNVTTLPVDASGMETSRVRGNDVPAVGQLAGVLPADPAKALSVDPATALGTDPAKALGTDPSKALGIDPSTALGTDPAKTLGVDPSTALGTDPSKALGTDPSKALGTDPSKALGTDPSKALGTDPSKALGTDPAKALGADQATGLGADTTKRLPLDPSTALPADPAGALVINPAKGLPAKAAKALSINNAKAVAGGPAVHVDPARARTVTPNPAPQLPGTGQTRLPALGQLPVTGDVKAPEVGGVTDPLGAIKPMAAAEPMPADTGSSIWVLATAAMLTVMSGALALTRRARLGGRR